MVRTIILSVFLLLGSLYLQAQSQWRLKWQNDSLGIYPEGLAQINDSTYLTTTAIYNFVSDTSYDAKLLTINQYGEVQDSLIDYSSTRGGFQIFRLNENHFVTTSMVVHSGEVFLDLCKFDSDLNMLWFHQYPMPETVSTLSNIMYLAQDSQENIYTTFDVCIGDNYDHNILACKFNSAGDSLIMKLLHEYNDSGAWFHGFVNRDDNSFLMVDAHAGEGNNLVEYDSLFNIKQAYTTYDMWGSFPVLRAMQHLVNYNDGFVFVNEIASYDRVELFKTNALFEIIDSVSFPVTHQQMNARSACVTESGNIYLVFGYSNSYVQTVIKYNSSLEEQWRRYVTSGEENGYKLDFISTSDDGLLLNFHYFWGIGYKVGAVFLKLGPNGELPLLVENTPIQLSESIAYPNPGSEHLTISVSKNLAQAQVKLYNLSGQLVVEQEFSGFDVRVPTSNLQQGTYVYRVEDDSQVLYSGKWIKK